MSLFLIYFEIGKPVPPSTVPPGMWHAPITVTFRGRSGPPRAGMVLTYGGSSEPFVAFERGYKQEGKVVRKSLLEFVQQRLELGAHPHLVLYWLGGKVEAVSVDVGHIVRVPANKLEDKFRAIEQRSIIDSSEVMEIMSDSDSNEVT